MKTLGQFSKLAFCALLASSCLQAEAQVDLVRGGKTKSVIILQDDTRENRTAANILQLFVGRISGADIPVVSNRKVKKGDILIGGQAPAGVKEDGYALSTAGGILKISGEANGVVYGAVSLLEDYLGVDYWGENEYSLKQSADISLPILSTSCFRLKYMARNIPSIMHISTEKDIREKPVSGV